MKPALLVVAAAIVGLIVALNKPEVAHLAFQAILVTALAVLVVTLVRRLAVSLPRSRYATGWRPIRRSRPELPREISSLVDLLAVPQRALPVDVTRRLTEMFEYQLLLHHGLSPNRDNDLPRIGALLSPTAFALVTARRQMPSGQRKAQWGLSRQTLGPLLTELESL